MSVRRTDSPRAQKGVALITVLLIVAMLVAILGRLSFDNQLWLRQTSNAANSARVASLTRAAQLWIRTLLDQDDPQVDAATEMWSRPLPPLPIPGGTLSGQIYDRQGRFNLNNLVAANGEPNEIELERFKRLLAVLDLNEDLAHAAVDWIDPNTKPFGTFGAEDAYYLAQDPPYLSANRPFHALAEVRLVRGFSLRTWQRLEPHVAAMPLATAINVNTASPEVIAAAMTNWGDARAALGRAERWTNNARTFPAPDLAAFAREAIGTEQREELPPGLSVSTRFFSANILISVDGLSDRIVTLYDRGDGSSAIVSQYRSFR